MPFQLPPAGRTPRYHGALFKIVVTAKNSRSNDDAITGNRNLHRMKCFRAGHHGRNFYSVCLRMDDNDIFGSISGDHF